MLTFDDIFLSQKDRVAVIQASETVVRLVNVDVNDLSESDVLIYRLASFPVRTPFVASWGKLVQPVPRRFSESKEGSDQDLA